MENGLELEANMAMSRGLKSYTVVDSIIDSDEFLDYAIAFQALRDKVDRYMNGLTMDERKAMEQAAAWSNVEDSRCLEEANKFYNYIENEFIAYHKALSLLESNTSYKKLNEEQLQLLTKEIIRENEPSLLKSRSVELTCAQKYQLAYDAIEIEWARTINMCNERYYKGTLEHQECLLASAVARNKKQDRIYQELLDCIEKEKKNK